MKLRFKPRHPQYHDLTAGNVYRVLGIEADYYRIMNDFGQPYLYPPNLFEMIDANKPRQWQTWRGEDGEHYAYPPEFQQPGFFEDYFDGSRTAMATLRRYLATLEAAPQSNRRKAG